ncbi:nitric oxide reductase activation protein NorD [Halomonas beimenensis]|uniref:Nitric oxide reductase activation protein NorD n=1 Tax=Halomonas beimenensis TaxID=475662 RepID=A0A291PCD8_9GAMM|nr:VWA domain-containing protein [Halomonas beimenensis]ATJ84574.1 nitric oxide reductase activation protein NorD [Halomonas beimenensis]
MLDFLEVEEFVGRHWHRWASGAASYPDHPEAAVRLETLRPVLGVFFRAGGGEAGIEVGAIAARASAHRLSLRQRLGLDEEVLDQARRDEEHLLLPPRIALFDQAALNRDLYLWLTAYLAEARPIEPPDDPLQADLLRLREARRTTGKALARFPGLAARHARLCRALLGIRPWRRRLPPLEAALEAALRAELGEAPPTDGWAGAMHRVVVDETLDLAGFQAPRGYRPPLPVPLWGRAERLGTREASRPEAGEDEVPGLSPDAREDDHGKRRADRREQDQADRDDPLILNASEKMLSWAEMVNLNRHVEDEEEEEARQAADQIDEIVLSPHRKRAGSRLKLDLDLAPGEAVGDRLRGRHTYPEWNHRRQAYLPDHCVVISGLQDEEGEAWSLDETSRRRIRRVRREFEALRPRRETLRGQLDGHELDTDALIRSRCDLAATGEASDRCYLDSRAQARDLAVSILVDVSLSTEAWLEDRRVLDVAKEALLALGHGLAGCGDDYAIHTFTSQRRHRVWVNTLKGFDEPMGERVERRVAALRPGHYTRMGPAIRHLTRELAERPNRHRLLLLLTDGKPNDTDYYEGRYGIEDTRKSVLEARRQEVRVFGVTIDREAGRYLPHLFGRGGYAIVQRPEHLSLALPGIYRQIIAT